MTVAAGETLEELKIKLHETLHRYNVLVISRSSFCHFVHAVLQMCDGKPPEPLTVMYKKMKNKKKRVKLTYKHSTFLVSCGLEMMDRFVKDSEIYTNSPYIILTKLSTQSKMDRRIMTSIRIPMCTADFCVSLGFELTKIVIVMSESILNGISYRDPTPEETKRKLHQQHLLDKRQKIIDQLEKDVDNPSGKHESKCIICADEDITHIYLSCGHAVLCGGCAVALVNKNFKTCVICNKPYTKIQKINYG